RRKLKIKMKYITKRNQLQSIRRQKKKIQKGMKKNIKDRDQDKDEVSQLRTQIAQLQETVEHLSPLLHQQEYEQQEGQTSDRKEVHRLKREFRRNRSGHTYKTYKQAANELKRIIFGEEYSITSRREYSTVILSIQVDEQQDRPQCHWIGCWTACVKSLMYNRNNKGDNDDPCGNPVSKCWMLELIPFNTTCPGILFDCNAASD
ncbi:hypothetical protein RFI_31282, partial [Reticulomyxa filosa]